MHQLGKLYSLINEKSREDWEKVELMVSICLITRCKYKKQAGVGSCFVDFCHQLQHNSGGFFFYTELFPALMQGNQVEESVLAALDRINARINEFDVVVIIRGGGATSDLSGFDTYLLAAACAQFPLPIITGIGHERDDTVLDSVAHTRVKTPTAAAELLIHRVAEVAEHLEELSMRIQQGAYMLLDLERRRLETLQTRIPNLVHRKLADARFSLLAAKKDLSQVTKALVARQSHRLELLQQRIADASPDKLLSRGYSITIKDGKAVTDASLLKPVTSWSVKSLGVVPNQLITRGI